MESDALVNGKKEILPEAELKALAANVPGSIFKLMALLGDGPKSGYDISTEVSSEEFLSWKDTFGNIYPNLRKMVDMGLAEKARDDFKGRKRVYYSLTGTGRQLLDWWLTEPAQRTPVRMELLFKLRFSAHLGPQVILRHLREYLYFCRMNHPMFEKWYSDVRRATEHSLEHEIERLTSDFWYRFTKMLLEWSEESVNRIEEYRKDNPPEGGGSCTDTPLQRCYSPLL